MEDELKSKLVEILTSIQAAAGQASDFALAQLPDIAQSYVLYGRAISTGAVLVGLAMFVGGMWALKRGVALGRVRATEGEGFLSAFAGGMTALIGFVMTLVWLNSAALVWFAPKVWLLKEIAHILK